MQQSGKSQDPKARGLSYHKFLQKMMKILKDSKKYPLTEDVLETSYLKTKDVMKYELDYRAKKTALAFLKGFGEIISIGEYIEKHLYDLIGIDRNGAHCAVDWKTGKTYPKDSNFLRDELLTKYEKVSVGYIVYVDQEKVEEVKPTMAQSGGTIKGLLKLLDKKNSEEESKNEELDSSSEFTDYIDSIENEKLSCSSPVNEDSKEEENEKSQELKVVDDEENERKIDLNRTIKVLQNQYLNTTKLVEEYGSIKAEKFFNELIMNPKDPKNQRWIKMFLDSISDHWKRDYLVAIRDYLRKYQKV